MLDEDADEEEVDEGEEDDEESDVELGLLVAAAADNALNSCW